LKTLLEKIEFIRSHDDQKIDEFFNISAISLINRKGQSEFYLEDISPQALYSSYKDFLDVMLFLYQQGAKVWCDVGCGIGRSCFLWCFLFDDVESFGIEYVEERLEISRYATRKDARLHWIQGDFSSSEFNLPRADVFFLYIASGPFLDSLLQKIKKLSYDPMLYVIESHGEVIARLKWESWWLKELSKKFKLHSHRHCPWGQIYLVEHSSYAFELEASWECRDGLLPDELSMHPHIGSYLLTKSYQKNWELIIEESDLLWSMDTLGLTWFDSVSIQGSYPVRQLDFKRFRVGLRRIPSSRKYKKLVEMRRNSQRLDLLLANHERLSDIQLRKIFLKPEAMLEFSDGSQRFESDILQWDVL
jgi:SAM-dependent methyltransferase